jgi:uncharacterized membrane protein YgdD (TMEM256/DUF423 family)
MSKKITLTGTILIFLGIILGAMAAHALEKSVSQQLVESFQKGVTYQFYIGFGFLIIGLNADRFQFNLMGFYILNLIGVLLFSGCIYLYALHEIIPELKNFVLIVPIGGSLMIIGWAVLFLQLLRIKTPQ